VVQGAPGGWGAASIFSAQKGQVLMAEVDTERILEGIELSAEHFFFLSLEDFHLTLHLRQRESEE
jgi:hypothetical protein